MIGRRVKRLGEENSTQINQLLSEIKRLEHIGSANKAWINLILEGDVNDISRMKMAQDYRNVGGDNIRPIFGIPLPYIKGGTHNLVLTRVKIGVALADADDYVNAMVIRGWTDYETSAEIENDGTNRTTENDFTYDFDDETIGGVYERLSFEITGFNTDAEQLKISYFQAEYYYSE